MADQRRSAWPLIVGFVVLAVLIAAAGYWVWRQQAQSIQRQAERSLAAVGELKADQITAWLTERHNDDETLGGDPLLSAAVTDMLVAHDAGRTTARVQAYLDDVQRNYDYVDVVLTSPNGEILVRAPTTATHPMGPEAKSLVARATTTLQVVSSDLFLDAEGHARLELVAPVLDDVGSAIAAVILHVDPGRYLYPYIKHWPLPSESGETLLVERRGDQVLYLNELRYRQDTALKLTTPLSTPNRPASMVVRGRRGVVQGIDYRGVPVLAALQRIPGTTWFIVAKEDAGEVLGAIRTRGWLTAGFAFLLVALAGVATLLLWRARESEASAEIKEREERYRALVQHAPMAIFVNREDRIVLANEACLRLFGATSPEQLVGKSPYDVSHPDCHPAMRERIRRVREEGEEVPLIEEMIVRLDGAVVDVEVAAAPFRDQGVDAIHVVLTDITERKLAEAELRETRDYLENLFGYANAPVIVWDQALRITRFNHAFEDLTHRTAGEVIGQHLELLFPEDERRTQALQRVTSATGGERWRVVEIPILRADGEVRTVLWNSATVYAADGDTPIATIAQGQDITERVQAEDALRASERKFAETIQALDEGYYSVTLDGHLLDYNPAFIRMLGIDPDADLRGQPSPDFWWDPADRAVYVEQLNTCGVIRDYLVRAKAADGSPLILLASAHLVHAAGGEVARIDGSVVDFTARKAAEDEIARLNTDLEQRVLDRTAQLDAANKELEAFAYSVSHDLRAPLRHISGFSALLAERVGDGLDEKSSHYVDTISRSVREMGVLIDDLLQFSRTGRAQLRIEPVDMDAALVEALEPLRRETEDRDIEWSIGPLPTVIGDHALLRQVWANLIGNAVKYSRGRAPARIEVGARDGDGAREDIFWVRDNGVGFDMQYAHKLFGVFQRLHSSADFEGTGIGLANVQRIINRLGGRVWAEGEVGHGATFSFSLPRRKDTPS